MAQSPLERLLQSLQYTHGLDPAVKQALLGWLQGNPLSDPRAVQYLTNFYPDPRQAVADVAATGRKAGPITVGAGESGNATGAQGPQPVAGPQPPQAGPQAPGVGSGIFGAASALGNTSPATPATPGGGEAPPVRAAPEPGRLAGPGQAGQAAGGLASQWMAGRANQQNGPTMNPVPTPSAAPTQQAPQAAGGGTVNPLPSGPAAGGGSASTVQGSALGPGSDNTFRVRQALQAAGVDPYSHGLRTQYLTQLLDKVLAARGETLGMEGHGADPTTYLDTLKNTVLSFLTPGQNGYAGQRAVAQGIMSQPGFGGIMANQNSTKDQQQLYQNLLQMEYGGENPSIQAAAQNVFGDTSNRYQDASLGFGPTGDPTKDLPADGLFSSYVSQQGPQSTIARILSGLYGR